MRRTASWCWVLALAAAGCTLIGEGELGDKPSEATGGGGVASATNGVGAATAVSSTGAATTSGPASSGPAGPGGGGPDCEPACAPGSVCQGNHCVCDSQKPAEAGACPPECNGDCDLKKGLCRILRDAECDGGCPETIVCPQGMDCEIRCKGEKACYEATIQCPESFACKVECDGYQTCKSSHLIGTSGALTLSCKNYEPCQDMDLDCGAGKCDYPCLNFAGASIDCGTSCDCACF